MNRAARATAPALLLLVASMRRGTAGRGAPGPGPGQPPRRLHPDPQAARRSRAEAPLRQGRGRRGRPPAPAGRILRRPHRPRRAPVPDGPAGRTRAAREAPAGRAQGVPGPDRPAGEEAPRPGKARPRSATAVATARPVLRLAPGRRGAPVPRRSSVRARRVPRRRRHLGAGSCPTRARTSFTPARRPTRRWSGQRVALAVIFQGDPARAPGDRARIQGQARDRDRHARGQNRAAGRNAPGVYRRPAETRTRRHRRHLVADLRRRPRPSRARPGRHPDGVAVAPDVAGRHSR